MDRVLELLVAPGIEAALGEVELQRLLVEDPQHGLLAEDRGQDRHAEVDLAGAVPQLDPAVLGQPALRDVEVRHDLQARDDRRLVALGRRQHLVEHAVHAEPDAELLLVGLPVQVGRAPANGVGQDHVDELHDRRLVGRLLELDDIGDRGLLFAEDLDVAGVHRQLGEHVGDRRQGLRVVALDRRPDGGAGGDDRQDAQPGHGGDLVHRHHVGRIRHGQREPVIDPAQREHLVLARDVRRHERQHVGRDRVLLDDHRRQPVLLAQQLDELFLGDQPAAREHVAQALLRAAVLAQGLLQLVGRDHALGHEELAQPPAAPAGASARDTGRVAPRGRRHRQPRLSRRHRGRRSRRRHERRPGLRDGRRRDVLRSGLDGRGRPRRPSRGRRTQRRRIGRHDGRTPARRRRRRRLRRRRRQERRRCEGWRRGLTRALARGRDHQTFEGVGEPRLVAEALVDLAQGLQRGQVEAAAGVHDALEELRGGAELALLLARQPVVRRGDGRLRAAPRRRSGAPPALPPASDACASPRG